jgi:hypothetical protein
MLIGVEEALGKLGKKKGHEGIRAYQKLHTGFAKPGVRPDRLGGRKGKHQTRSKM